MKPVLKIFVADYCSGCKEALETAESVRQQYPNVLVNVIDITNSSQVVPEAVFATPTYMLNNRVVSLGNPAPEDIARWLANGESERVTG